MGKACEQGNFHLHTRVTKGKQKVRESGGKIEPLEKKGKT